MNFPFFLIFECISFFASLVVYFWQPTTVWLRLFPPFLFLTIVTELLGFFIAAAGKPNGHVYNVYVIVSALFYYYVLYQTSGNKKIRKYIQYTACFLPVVTATNFFIQGMDGFHSYSYSFGAISIAIFSAINLFELVKRPDLPKLSRQPVFWITIALLFFYACSFPILSSFNLVKFWAYTVYDILNLVLRILVCLFYSLLAIGFLCIGTKSEPPSSPHSNGH